MDKAVALTTTHRFVGLGELSDRIEPAVLRTFRAALLRRWPDASAGARAARFIGATVLMTIVSSVLIVLPSGILFLMAGNLTSFGEWGGAALALVGGCAVTAAIGYPLGRWALRVILRDLSAVGGWRHWYRLTRLAARNDLTYLPEQIGSPPRGTLLASQGNGTFHDVFVDGGTPLLKLGNFVPAEPASFPVADVGWGFLAIEMDRQMDGVMLVPAHGSKLRVGLIGGEQVTLPARLARRYSLYAADGHDDALDVITPALIELMVRQLPGAFAEAVGRNLIITVPRPWRFTSARTWQVMEWATDAVPARGSGLAGGAGRAGAAGAAGAARESRRVAPGFVSPAPRGRQIVSWLPLVTGLLVGLATAVRGMLG